MLRLQKGLKMLPVLKPYGIAHPNIELKIRTEPETYRITEQGLDDMHGCLKLKTVFKLADEQFGWRTFAKTDRLAVKRLIQTLLQRGASPDRLEHSESNILIEYWFNVSSGNNTSLYHLTSHPQIVHLQKVHVTLYTSRLDEETVINVHHLDEALYYTLRVSGIVEPLKLTNSWMVD